MRHAGFRGQLVAQRPEKRYTVGLRGLAFGRCFYSPSPLGGALHKNVILAARRVRQRPCSPPRLADLVQKRPARGNSGNSLHSTTPTPLRTNSQRWDFWPGKDLKHSFTEAPLRHVLEPRLLPLPPALDPCPFATPPPSSGRGAKLYRKPLFVQSLLGRTRTAVRGRVL